MTLHKLTAGSGYTYLTHQVAAHDATDKPVGGLGAYYSDKGEMPGAWMGRGLGGLPEIQAGSAVTEAQMLALFGQGRHPSARRIEGAAQAQGLEPDEVDLASRLGKPYRVFEPSSDFRRRCAVALREFNADLGLPSVTPVPTEERARIRTEVTHEMFTETYGRPPLDARELSGHLARISRQATTAVAGYDLTFSPVKSVSTLWAIAPRDAAAVIERAHADAVDDTISWLEEHATYSRTGHNGVAQVDVKGLIAASFTHRDSRSGDPDLHTHVAVSNKVQLLDGRWLALDGRAIYKNNVAASERYNTRVEGLLTDRLGVRFADRDGGAAGKRPIREIVGVGGPLPRFWSSRRAAIDVRRAVLAATFQEGHGRPPTAKEAVQLAQQANLETRAAKHEPRSYAQQRSTWKVEALAVLGGDTALRDYLRGALHGQRAAGQELTEAWAARTADVVVSVMEGSRAVWQETHVRAEAERQIRAASIAIADVDRAGDAIVEAALSPLRSIRIGGDVTPVSPPALLRRSDGTSVFDVAGAAVFTSAKILTAEATVLSAAARGDGRTLSHEDVDAAVAASTAGGFSLNSGQVHLVRDLATSGARVQLALAPAGTGKTTALRALTDAWRTSGGTVVGLAPSAAASAVLRDQIGTATDTLAKVVHAVATGIDVPTWVKSIGPRTLVLLDEAAMAGTLELAAMVEFVTSAGGSVRLIGDDQQLGAVGAGGLLRDLAHSQGAVRLTEVVRFIDPVTGAPNRAEGAASLALRDGDPSALAHYLDRGRLHVGDRYTTAEAAFAAWASDQAAGRDALLLAPTRSLVAELNDRARAERLGQGQRPSVDVPVADSGRASVGDVVITRRNDRTLMVGASDWVKNGDRWTVSAVRDSGQLDVVHRRSGKSVTLPARYVRDHVTLGYASTVHGAQGITAERCHSIATGAESRQLIYVAMTRGRHENHLYLATVGDGDPHDAITRDALLPPTAVDVLQRVLARDDTRASAAQASQDLSAPDTRLRDAAEQYHYALTTAASDVIGPAALARIDAAAELGVPGLTDEDSYPVLRSHLALCAAGGKDPVDLLNRVIADPRGLGDARDMAAVLEWRLDPDRNESPRGPLPWLPAPPEPLLTDAGWGPYLADRADEISMLAALVAATARAWTATNAPAWATAVLEHEPSLAADLAVWRAAHGIPTSEHRLTGSPLHGAADVRCQAELDAREARLLGRPGIATADHQRLADTVDPRVVGDPWWPVLAGHLIAAELAGVDVPALVKSVGSRALPDELPAAALWWRLSDHLALEAADVDERVVVDAPALDDPYSDVNEPTPEEISVAPALVTPKASVQAPERARLLTLNSVAADYFTAAYPESWARSYLGGRLGYDLVGHDQFVVGYAPTGWTGITDHLRAWGAADEEIVASGLGCHAASGRVIDRFRDRVVFAIQGADGIHGWIGRRNPAEDNTTGYSSPKYLNTAETALFHKGTELYGLVEGTDALAGGGTPVLVEGPVDALAVTLSGGGRFVGIAPLGTSFTDAQADLLLPFLSATGPGVIMGVDDDAAGRAAAGRIFWLLTDRGRDPRRLELPAGSDPAGLLHEHGRSALRKALNAARSQATSLIDERVDAFADRLDTVEGRVHATRRAAEVIAATPQSAWPEHLTHVVVRTSIAADIALAEVLDAAEHRAAAEASTDAPRRTRATRGPVRSESPPATAPRRALAGVSAYQVLGHGTPAEVRTSGARSR